MDSRYLGIKLKNGPAKNGHSRTRNAPILEAASGNVPQMNSGSKNGFTEQKIHTDQERGGWNVENVG